MHAGDSKSIGYETNVSVPLQMEQVLTPMLAECQSDLVALLLARSALPSYEMSYRASD